MNKSEFFEKHCYTIKKYKKEHPHDLDRSCANIDCNECPWAELSYMSCTIVMFNEHTKYENRKEKLKAIEKL